MRAMVIKLRYAPRHLIIQGIICAASQHPSCTSIRWPRINICVRDSDQPMAKQTQPFTTRRNLRPKQHIEFMRVRSAL